MSTLRDAKYGYARIPQTLNVGPEDPRFVHWVNQSEERLLHRGKYWGSCRRFNVSIDSQLLTLPPQLATPEQIAVANEVLPIHGLWYELLPGGWSVRDETLTNGTGIHECIYRGNYPTIKDIATAGTITLKCDVASDATKTVLVMGYDDNGNWIRTFAAGVWSDGETIALAQGAGTTSTNKFSSITSVRAPSDLDGQWWMYLGDVATGTLIGHYQYWETAPSYKRYLVPFVNTTVSTVVITGKLAFRPVSQDTDELILGNLSALKLACLACKAEEDGNFGLAQLLWNGGTNKAGQSIMGAIQELDAELGHHLGDGQQVGLSIVGSGAGYGERVETLI